MNPHLTISTTWYYLVGLESQLGATAATQLGLLSVVGKTGCGLLESMMSRIASSLVSTEAGSDPRGHLGVTWGV